MDGMNMVKPETRQSCLRREKFGHLGVVTGIYALFYTLCMYRNTAGVTYPFFIAGSLFFFCYCMRKLEITVKRGSTFYMGAMILLGISTVCTADGRIVFFNHLGVLLLMISFLLHQFYDDSKWGFGKYLASMIATLFGSIGEVTKPFTDFMYYRSQNGKKSGKGIYVLVGACVSVPMVLVVWFLLMSADRVFMDMSEGLFDAINPDNIFGMVCSFVLMFLAAYGVLAYLGERHLGEEIKEVKRMESTLAITVMVPLTLLYIVFCGVQVFCLFLGNVELTNMTYAEYARQGFFQLLFICILNLIMVLVGGHYFKESKVLKGIMTVVSVCTYIMIFSSAFRMVLYIKHYYLTFLRILVLWALAVIFMLLTGVLISIYVRKFPLFRYGVIVVSVCYIALSFSKPDYWIATCNLGNVEKAEESFFDADAYQDYRYLSGLSADAAPAILPYLGEKGYNIAEGTWGYRYLKDLREDVEDMSFREWNLSKYMAVKNLQQYE